jgi:hypothetical protein
LLAGVCRLLEEFEEFEEFEELELDEFELDDPVDPVEPVLVLDVPLPDALPSAFEPCDVLAAEDLAE